MNVMKFSCMMIETREVNISKHFDVFSPTTAFGIDIWPLLDIECDS